MQVSEQHRCVLAFVVVSLIILLIMWLSFPFMAIVSFLWFLFAGIIFCLMISAGHSDVTPYFFVLVFTFPVMAIVLGAFSYYLLQ